MPTRALLLIAIALFVPAHGAAGAERVVFDTDIGGDIDDGRDGDSQLSCRHGTYAGIQVPPFMRDSSSGGKWTAEGITGNSSEGCISVARLGSVQRYTSRYLR